MKVSKLLKQETHRRPQKPKLLQIYRDMKINARDRGETIDFRLFDLQNNAPAIFHMLYAKPQFAAVFHNKERQLELYYTSGVKAILDDFFYQVGRIAAESNGKIPQVPHLVREGTYQEAKLWCKIFHLRWM